MKNIRYISGFKLLAAIVCVLGAVAAALGALRALNFAQGLVGEDSLALHSLWWFLGGLLAVLLGLGWLAYSAGRSARREGVRLLGIDRIYADVCLALACFAGGLCATLLYSLLSGLHFGTRHGSFALYAGGAALAACIALLSVFCVTLLARRMKRGELLKHTFVYVFFPWLIRTARTVWGATPMIIRWILMLVLYASLTCVCVLIAAVDNIETGSLARMIFSLASCILLQALAIAYLVRNASALKTILSGVQKIKSGDFAHRIKAKGGPPFTDIATAVNNIADGLNAAVDDRVKAERMKAELVTNVSHDLKTPLTSIITYVDLLKAEGPGGENAAKYVDVLDSKTKRLKALTEDLFEAAKAMSGSIKPCLLRLNVVELMSQGLGELADRIKESGLDFRISLIGEKLFIQADGKLLWRVVENLLSNVFKYALPHSRVYVSTYSVRGLIRIEIKNISAYELNIPVEELTERFTRGDASRGSEGSGLGLAIAKSLTELQGGSFKIEIDGDLFKAIVEFREDI